MGIKKHTADYVSKIVIIDVKTQEKKHTEGEKEKYGKRIMEEGRNEVKRKCKGIV